MVPAIAQTSSDSNNMTFNPLLLLLLLFSILMVVIVSPQPTSFPIPQQLYGLSSTSLTLPPSSFSSVLSLSQSLTADPPHHSHPLVPAFFVIGDSSVDCGTNNFLGTFARADHLPYGRDFDTHQPTGRFCNGRIPVDYLGNYLFFFSFP